MFFSLMKKKDGGCSKVVGVDKTNNDSARLFNVLPNGFGTQSYLHKPVMWQKYIDSFYL